MNNDLRPTSAPRFNIAEGDTVRDRDNNDIGTVKAVRFSDDNPHTIEAEAATETAGTADAPRDVITRVIADVFTDDIDMPDELRQQLLQQGFIRIRRGMLQADVFARMNQVSHTGDGIVYLNAHKDELLSI